LTQVFLPWSRLPQNSRRTRNRIIIPQLAGTLASHSG
jgi:hypothetical protein